MKRVSAIFCIHLFTLTLTGCDGQGLKYEIKDTKGPGYSLEEKQHENAPESYSPTLSSRGTAGVDFRFAARKATHGVVHVKSTWTSVEKEDFENEFDPFKEFFGDEFWFRFFQPFYQRGPVQLSASGVIVTSDGYIITNNHVIEGADTIEVVLHDQRYYKAKVIGADPQTDIALIKIDEKDLSVIYFGNSDEVEVGQWVLAVGNPFNLASTVTAGIVSAKARNINILRDQEAIESFIQTDAAVNPGNSGGALVDLKGNLIGINTAIATPTGTYAGYSFAIPVNIVKKVADDLIKFGAVQRAYLGVIIRDMTGSFARERHLPFIPGVYVDSLVAQGAASQAGVKKGDIIISIDRSKVGTSSQLQEIVAKHRPGERIAITVLRNNQEKSLTILLKGTSSIPAAAADDSILKNLGIEVQELSTAEKSRYGLKSGLKVISIFSGRISESTNMEEGFIITKVNNEPVSTKEDMINVIKRKPGAIMLEGTYPGSGQLYFYGFGI